MCVTDTRHLETHMRACAHTHTNKHMHSPCHHQVTMHTQKNKEGSLTSGVDSYLKHTHTRTRTHTHTQTHWPTCSCGPNQVQCAQNIHFKKCFFGYSDGRHQHKPIKDLLAEPRTSIEHFHLKAPLYYSSRLHCM